MGSRGLEDPVPGQIQEKRDHFGSILIISDQNGPEREKISQMSTSKGIVGVFRPSAEFSSKTLGRLGPANRG